MATDWRQVARQAAISAGIDADIFERQIGAESNFNPNAGSPAGAQGIAQIMPATAKGWKVDPMNPTAALNAAAKAMGKYLNSYGGDWKRALAAYNAGVGAVAKYNGVPPYAETQNYIKKILGGTNPTAKATKPAGAATAPVAGVSAAGDPRTQALEFIMQGSPFEGMATSRYTPTRPSALPSTSPAGPNVATGKGVPKRRKGETGQQYLDRILMARYGFKHDAGNAQTTGGKHKGQGHYAGKATDFGDAKNDPTKLQEAEDWLEANATALGLRLALYGNDEEGHGDHLHAETLHTANKQTPLSQRYR